MRLEEMRPLRFAVFLLFGLGVVVSLLSVQGEMCSAMIKATAGDDLTTLRVKTFAAFRRECRLNKDQLDESKSCSFSTVAAKPHIFKFILKPTSAPFRLNFAVTTKHDAAIALAENTALESIFVEINIGGGGNVRAVVRPCYYIRCRDIVAQHNEAGLVTANKCRPFWIDYQGGVVKVGKGGQEEAFLEWDAGAHHLRVPSQVHIGISSWVSADANWVFHQFCK